MFFQVPLKLQKCVELKKKARMKTKKVLLVDRYTLETDGHGYKGEEIDCKRLSSCASMLQQCDSYQKHLCQSNMA